MSSQNDDINFAKAFGFESTAAAIVFAILYAPLLFWFILQSFKRFTRVFLVLTIFCSIRVVAFTIRAILTASESAGHNFHLLIADEVLSSIGFFGLLYSAYTIVLDREALAGYPVLVGILNKLLRNRILFRLTMSGAIALGITGLVQAQESGFANGGSSGKGSGLRKASTVIFLVLTLLQGYLTAMFAYNESKTVSDYKTDRHELIGQKYACVFLSIVACLLLIREVFTTATLGDLKKQNQESLWYTLVAVPEVVAVILYATPGLVPDKNNAPKSDGVTLVEAHGNNSV